MVSMNQRELFTFLFEQNPFSSYNFRSEIIEASTIMADILLKRPSIALCIYNLYALKATQWHSLYIIITSYSHIAIKTVVQLMGPTCRIPHHSQTE